MALVFITGGARSGKSSAAGRLARQRSLDGSHVRYVVFGRPTDREMAHRIERHRAERADTFETIEPEDATSWLDEDDGAMIVVDCLGTLLGRVMDEQSSSDTVPAIGPEVVDPDHADAVGERFLGLVGRLAERPYDTIVVSNEVGSGVVPAYPSGRLFRDLLGQANRHLADRADVAYLAVAGRLIDLSRAPNDVAWPED